VLVVFAQQVYNKRSQQEELLGFAELSISTFLKNTGQVNDITVNLTYGDQYHAGQVCCQRERLLLIGFAAILARADSCNVGSLDVLASFL